MTSNTVSKSYEQLAQDAIDGNIPSAPPICKDCSELGIPFSINDSDGPRDADEWLGIPSNERAATTDWFTSNPWIRDPVQNFRDSYLLRVLDRAGELYGEAWLAEFHAFQCDQELEFHYLEHDMGTDPHVTPAFMMEVAHGEPMADQSIDCGTTNGVFLGRRIYLWSFTSARYSMASATGNNGQPAAFSDFEWSVSGLYDPQKAAQELAKNYQRAKTLHKLWERIKGLGNITLGVLSLIPALGMLRGLFGATRAVRYTFAVVDGALALNAVVSGSTSLIKGEGIDHGEQLFEHLGALADPKDGAERGRQVFMFINLAMLTPAAFGGARWILRKIRPDIPVNARLDLQAVTGEERRRLGGHKSVDPVAIELRGTRPSSGRHDDTGEIKWSDRPSLDTNSSQITLTTAVGKANYAVIANTLRSRLKMMIIHRGGSLKVVGRMGKVVGDAGEEAFAAAMVEKMGFNAERILGYSNKPGLPSRFGLTNKSGHGLDMLVWVPPPPSLTVRAPTTDAMRHGLDSAKGIPAATQTLNFTDDTLLVIETKTTLGRTKTPKFNSTQTTGASKLGDLQKKIEARKQGWTRAKMLEVDPSMQDKLNALENALALEKIEFMHAQIFFDSQGALNRLAGNGSGIQLNIW
ncbi:hypothetical protein EDF81_3303 [Enterobacter sp. BIGb0383]|uniref:hypothetical protein n=1 Tax=unclassified Enterobacter TaxID=2608935 RepID=UPI000F4821F7|nr:MULTISPECIES: hypothetical protein [unclassified Enterobacter]ROP58140.1 hypothetical protein EDF81_3303 [Enterobacter sp. BIGb0383]ROS00793.1 hypothetical protein EC848_4183 [Enterobacter sp. BIGb0359]